MLRGGGQRGLMLFMMLFLGEDGLIEFGSVHLET